MELFSYFLLDCLVLVHKNTTDSCVLVLYPAALLNSFFSSSSFFVNSFILCINKIITSVNRDTSSFPVWAPFISFSCLLALTRTSSMVMNSSGECGHPCFVPDFGENTLSLSPLSMFAGFFIPPFFLIVAWHSACSI